jgi:hypothetical protein
MRKGVVGNSWPRRLAVLCCTLLQVYNEESIAAYWRNRPGELTSRWTKFAGISGECSVCVCVCVCLFCARVHVCMSCAWPCQSSSAGCAVSLPAVGSACLPAQAVCMRERICCPSCLPDFWSAPAAACLSARSAMAHQAGQRLHHWPLEQH